MNNVLLQQAIKLNNERKRRNRRRRTIQALSVFVVFCTTYALILPAITMERDPICGYEAHAHGDSCYTEQLVRSLQCPAVEAEDIIHEHDVLCYDEGGALICRLEEKEAHSHDDSCYVCTELVCAETHEHGDACYADCEPKLTCHKAERVLHSHDKDCYIISEDPAVEPVLICTAAVVVEHIHADSCVAEETVNELTCGEEEHAHEDRCYPIGEDAAPVDENEADADSTWGKVFCGRNEHSHGDDCWQYGDDPDVPPVLVCIMPEHTHSAVCFPNGVLPAESADAAAEAPEVTPAPEAEEPEQPVIGPEVTCTAEEHTHDDTCFTEGSTDPVCGKTEHTHSPEECCEPVKADYTYEDDFVSMTVHVVSWMPLSEGLTMQVTVLDADNEAYTSYEEYALENSEGDLLGLNGYAITFTDGVTEMTLPDADITVDLTVKPVQYEQPATFSLRAMLTTEEETPEAGITVTVLQDGTDGVTSEGNVTYDEGAEQTDAMTFALGGRRTLALAAARAVMPSFTVEYYSELPIFNQTDVDGTGKYITVIDTTNTGDGTGGNLPKNGTDPSTVNLYLKEWGTTNEDASGTKTTYKISTTQSATEVYLPEDKEYFPGMTTADLNKLSVNSHYALHGIWVSYDGGTTWTRYGTIVEVSDEDKYDKHVDDVHTVTYTNNEALKNQANTIYIAENSIVQFHYTPLQGTYSNAANFFDYDISDGKFYASSSGTGTAYNTVNAALAANGNGRVWMKTNKRGINSSANYSGSGAYLAFGNSNTGTGYQTQTLNGNYINQYNGSGFKGCSFGIATGYDIINDRLIYASGLRIQALFNDEAYYGKTMTGKTTYTGNTLNFERIGDTYTLQYVNGGTGALSESRLDEFFSPNGYSHIITNNFWPMDGLVDDNTTGHDMEFGTSADYGTSVSTGKRNFIGVTAAGTTSTSRLPPSDEYNRHNSYFGMQYAVNFTLDGEYSGPLEYLFYGDDDMWVFLTYPDGTTKKICDIGGVHSSVGSYTDLWDWIKKGEAGKGDYTMSFFYTERGASGSSCYMAFTIPHVTSVTQNTPDYGSLTVTKRAESDSVVDRDYTFKLELSGKAGYDSVFPYVIESGNSAQRTGEIATGETFTIKAGEIFTLSSVPAGMTYKLTEILSGGLEDAFAVKWDKSGGSTIEGTILSGTISGGTTEEFTCTNTAVGNLNIAKTINGSYDGTEVFAFDVTLADKNGNPVNGTFGGVTFTKGAAVVTVGVDKTVAIKGIPVGYTWTVTEQDPGELYTVAYKVDGTAVTAPSGTITHDTTIAVAAENTLWYTLPNTGGPGTFLYTLGGMLLLASAGVYTCILRHKRRKGGG